MTRGDECVDGVETALHVGAGFVAGEEERDVVAGLEDLLAVEPETAPIALLDAARAGRFGGGERPVGERRKRRGFNDGTETEVLTCDKGDVRGVAEAGELAGGEADAVAVVRVVTGGELGFYGLAEADALGGDDLGGVF